MSVKKNECMIKIFFLKIINKCFLKTDLANSKERLYLGYRHLVKEQSTFYMYYLDSSRRIIGPIKKIKEEDMKKIILLPFMAFALAISPVTFAKSKSCPCMDVQKLEKELNLTSEQKNKIMEIRKQAKEQMKGKWEEMKNLYKQKKELVRSEKMDEAKLDELINQKKEIIATMMKTKIMTKHQIYNVLDAKQKEQYAAMMDKWEHKKMEKMKNMDDDDDMGNE